MDMAKACNTNDVRTVMVELKELESAKPSQRICNYWKAVTGASHRREPTKQPLHGRMAVASSAGCRQDFGMFNERLIPVVPQLTKLCETVTPQLDAMPWYIQDSEAMSLGMALQYESDVWRLLETAIWTTCAYEATGRMQCS